MKRILPISIAALALVVACQQTPLPAPVDMEAETATLTAMFDSINLSFAEKDAGVITSMLAEKGWYAGTDPGELWTRAEMVSMWDQMFAEMDPEMDTRVNLISDRVIKVAPDGNSAVVMDQYLMTLYTPNIAWRNVYHLVKEEGQWKIMFLSSALIPENEDLMTLNAALEENPEAAPEE